MADLSATYTMSTDPAIKHTVSYQSYRSGTTIYCRFRVSIAPIYGSQYFGYNLLASLNLNGSAVATDFTLKSASPNRWTSAIVVYLPSSSGWYSVSGIKTASTISASISFRSSQTHGTASSGNRTVNVPSAAAPKAPAVSLSTTTVLPSGTVRIGASGASWGDGGAGSYTYQYNTGSGWKTFYSGSSAQTIDFSPQKYGGTYGTKFRIRAQITNGWGQQATGSEVSFSCVSKTGTPGNFTASPSPMKRRDTLLLAWTAPSAGSGSITGYKLAVQYNGGSWLDLGEMENTSFSTRPLNYSGFKLRSGGVLRYKLTATNSYGVQSDAAYISVAIQGGSFFYKHGGTWDDSGTMYIRMNGAWREADDILIKTGGQWRQP